IVALHSLVTDDDVLQGIVKGVAHVQLSGNIRRRHHRSKRFSAAVHLRMEIFLLTPFLIQLWLNLFGIVGLFQVLAHSILLILAFHTIFTFVKEKTLYTSVKGDCSRGTTFII